MPTPKECISGSVSPAEWPPTMEEFYSLCDDDDLAKIILHTCYAHPWGHYPYTVGDHVKAMLGAIRSQR